MKLTPFAIRKHLKEALRELVLNILIEPPFALRELVLNILIEPPAEAAPLVAEQEPNPAPPVADDVPFLSKEAEGMVVRDPHTVRASRVVPSGAAQNPALEGSAAERYGHLRKL